MGTNNSTLKDLKPEGTSVLSTSNSSSKSLIHKLHSNLYRNRSNQSSSEKINELSSSPTSFKKKKLFKRKPNTVEQDDNTSELFPSSSNDELASNTSSMNDDPMLAAATRISARFDEEQSSLSPSSSDLCVVSHYISSRLANCCLEEDPCFIHTAKVQSSPVTTTEHLQSSASLENNKRTKDWLNNASNTEKLDSSTPKQNVASSFFFRPDNPADQRKEKDRQQRLVKKKLSIYFDVKTLLIFFYPSIIY